MIKNERKGFTLIEILIVVAIIAILASVVLVGLGPTQSLGRDARRVSDIHSVQNGLELYYNKCGNYPGTASCGAVTAPANWAALGTALTGTAGLGVSNIPNDPSHSASNNKDYAYGVNSGDTPANTAYMLEATLENKDGGPWNGYSTPTMPSANMSWTASGMNCTQASQQYCITL